ncbi:disintegrin and metalloproteinase domain-containing protein 32-like isoform X4 [Cyanistes caeruleus]|uniref:disintegrin and metalloproteinase domain-containing protein 32-like isoform X4 n=1 Tax=Cyanistes caeruleus TaxID=156563 RepID=UPI000CDA9FB8|nr:disintegrin and metalloproteinase domain-containing protein 32-like isoform X4 [Cyanistes caeruleus]
MGGSVPCAWPALVPDHSPTAAGGQHQRRGEAEAAGLAWIVLFPTPCSQFSPSLLFCVHKDAVSYMLRIEGRPYTIHLQEHAFLSDGFQTYVSSEQGSLQADSAHVEGGCHYWGYIDGFPGSAVTLSTCSGLRGLLQFENVSYEIQPLGYSPAFQHMLYRMSEEQRAEALPAHSPQKGGEMLDKAHGEDEPLSAAAQSPKYLMVYVVLDKALYNYMGSDPNAATQKVIQAFNLINNMFNPLNVTIVLSSLELWAEGDKISTAGDTDDLLQRFLQWKHLSLEPQAHNIASLLGYRDQGAFTAAAAPGGACERDAAATVALYHGNVTLESFSILLAQGLGRSLGMGPDSSRGCGCPGRVCTMSPEALHFSGAKAFSNCSIRGFESFLKRGKGACLFGSPRLSRRSGALCGNGVVDPGEQCDCGTAQECLKSRCCTQTCRLKPRARCASGLCCRGCQFRRRNAVCRPAADAQCDLPEFCSGSSASCPPDVFIQDGHDCGHGSGYCYQGRCHSSDLQCKRLYGKESRNAPIICYEEINGQKDRFGHCGFKSKNKYRPCTWRDLRCGKLVCTYPSHKPFSSTAAAVIYAQVRHHLCVSLNYLNIPAWLDPLLVPPGTKCGSGRVCINNTCHPLSELKNNCDSKTNCHGHGVCNNKGNCHCYPGWQPPDCHRRGSRRGGSKDSGLQLTAGLCPARPTPSTGGWGDGLAGAGLQPRPARAHRGPGARPVAAVGAGPVPQGAAAGRGAHHPGHEQGAGAGPGDKPGAGPRAGPGAADRPRARARPRDEDRHGPSSRASAGAAPRALIKAVGKAGVMALWFYASIICVFCQS